MSYFNQKYSELFNRNVTESRSIKDLLLFFCILGEPYPFYFKLSYVLCP